VRRVRLVFALALLAHAGPAQARPLALDPHVHGSAVVGPVELVKLARREGGVDAGVRALGLDHLPPPQAMREALAKMDLYAPDHAAAYRAIRNFRLAAFAGPRYQAWVQGVVRNLRRNAKRSYVQLSLRDVAPFLAAAHSARLDLTGIDLLIEMRRNDLDMREVEEALARYPQIHGIDILGAEVDRLDPRTIDRALAALAASGRSSPIVRIHVGDGSMGEVFPENVNLTLARLVAQSAKLDLRRFRIVLAHVAHIGDLAAARRDLNTLARRGVEVAVNVNPLSNLVYQAARDVREIDALKLGVPVLAGTDNVGSLARNQRIVDLLASGRGDEAARLAQRSLRQLRAQQHNAAEQLAGSSL
jgi:hypothetical protein